MDINKPSTFIKVESFQLLSFIFYKYEILEAQNLYRAY